MNFFEVLQLYSCLSCQLKTLRNFLCSNDFFADLYSWSVEGFYPNCKIIDGCLYDCEGNLLSSDGSCMDEEIPYFVNQSTGYLCDDYYGTMFVKTNDQNYFVAISYSC